MTSLALHERLPEILVVKKCRKAKWLSEEALQIAVKSKGEKERYTHLNAEFQIIARREKKTFLSSQCTEIEENNRMGKTRDQTLSLWRRNTDSKTLAYQRTKPRGYQIVRTHTKETT